MQFRLPVAILIFVGSYFPLSLILLAQDFDYSMIGRPLCWDWTRCVVPLRNPVLSLSIVFVCVVCVVVTLATLAFVRPKREIVIQEAKHVTADLMNYVLPYVVSFMSLDYQETGKFIGLIIFLSWMFWITYKSGQIILNPLLIAFGWRLYDVSYVFPASTVVQSGIALANTAITAGDRHRHVAVQDVLIIKAVPEPKE